MLCCCGAATGVDWASMVEVAMHGWEGAEGCAREEVGGKGRLERSRFDPHSSIKGSRRMNYVNFFLGGHGVALNTSEWREGVKDETKTSFRRRSTRPWRAEPAPSRRKASCGKDAFADVCVATTLRGLVRAQSLFTLATCTLLDSGESPSLSRGALATEVRGPRHALRPL